MATHDHVRVEQMDVTDDQQIASSAAMLSEVPIDIRKRGRPHELFDAITFEDTGRFIDYDGTTAPW